MSRHLARHTLLRLVVGLAMMSTALPLAFAQVAPTNDNFANAEFLATDGTWSGTNVAWFDVDGDADLDYFVAGAYWVPNGNNTVDLAWDPASDDATVAAESTFTIGLPNDTDSDGYGNRCDPDFNGDEVVNTVDLGYLKSVFFSADPHADLNGDTIVNVLDLAIVRTFFFLAPGPSGIAS